MKVSIVVPAFNEERLLGGCLEQVREASGAWEARGWQWELVVCDNNSTDRTADIARAAGASVVFESHNQIARARNAGAAAATGDWLIFIDADSYPSRELFGEVADKIEEGGWIAGGCLVLFDEHLTPFWRFWLHTWNWLSRRFKMAAGCFVVCDAAAFRAVDGFDTALYASEEVDLSFRLRDLGRPEGRDLFILQTRIRTSARKIHLYSRWELLGFMIRSLLRPYRFVKSRRACGLWYDGRR